LLDINKAENQLGPQVDDATEWVFSPASSQTKATVNVSGTGRTREDSIPAVEEGIMINICKRILSNWSSSFLAIGSLRRPM
jgi:hypothetical protein